MQINTILKFVCRIWQIPGRQLLMICLLFLSIPAVPGTPPEDGKYTLVIEGFDWGAAVSKVILPQPEPISTVNDTDFQVTATRHTDCLDLPANQKAGERRVVFAYVSDEAGNRVGEGDHVTLVLAVGPDLYIGYPLQYLSGEDCRGTKWLDYQLEVKNTATGQIWNQEQSRRFPLIDRFDLTGRFHHVESDIKLRYASFVPKKADTKRPLIIWLHGGGEGGTDTSVPLLANRAANYASDEIQAIFGGAYVLVPQTPGAWMHTAEGKYFRGRENDAYNVPLMALIRDYVARHPQIDTNRIYVGGCSNGGYMSFKLIVLYPDYFAAGFVVALAYRSTDILDDEINAIKNVPIWFVQSADDQVTPANITATPVYERLINAGAKNVHYSLTDHVVDITGFYGGDAYRYNGHLSWIYVHANRSRLDFDGSPVLLDGRPVSIMEWLAGQEK